jgi:membrane fusion protein (multidrug efflux system)
MKQISPKYLTQKQLLMPFLLIFGFSWSSCGKKNEQSSGSAPAPNKSAPLSVDVFVARATPLSNSIEVNGSIIANEFVELHSEVAGRLIQLNVPEGKTIQQGTLIAKVYDEDLQAQQRKIEAQLNLAQANEQRLKKLLDINGVNQQEYDAVVAQVAAFRADIELVQANLRKTQLLAPFTGVMGLRQVSMGAYVTPQTTIATLQETNRMKIDFNVPETFVTQVKRGAKVTVQSENGNAKYSATISAIEPQVNATTRNLKVRAVFDGKTEFSAGMFARVLLDAGSSNNAILIPSNAIIPDTRNKRVAVIKNGKANFQLVETGVRQMDNVQIIKGLSIGDSIAVSGILFLRPDMAVQVKKTVN